MRRTGSRTSVDATRLEWSARLSWFQGIEITTLLDGCSQDRRVPTAHKSSEKPITLLESAWKPTF